MKTRYRLIRRGVRNGAFYCVDKKTGKRTSLHTDDEDAALQIVEAKNQAQRQPVLNLQIAKAYLAGTDSAITKRTWQDAIAALIETKHGANQKRWRNAAKDQAFKILLPQIIIETQGETLLKVLQSGTVSTNVFLRRLHNFCVDMAWLPWPLVPKRQWPPVRFNEKRAITWEEHSRIVERERNPERKAFYQLAWHLGASQSDLANLHAEDVDWENHVISFFRMKTRWRGQQPPQIRFSSEVEEILGTLPNKGPLFPYLRSVREADRATEFRQRCQGLKTAFLIPQAGFPITFDRAPTAAPTEQMQMTRGLLLAGLVQAGKLANHANRPKGIVPLEPEDQMAVVKAWREARIRDESWFTDNWFGKRDEREGVARESKPPSQPGRSSP